MTDLDLKNAYDSDSDDVLNEFYVPVLSHSIRYNRLAGFFSSSSLAVAAKGISRFIANGGHMRLICSAKLTEADVDAIKKAHDAPEELIAKIMVAELERLENELIRDHVGALAWMMATGKLEIKVAIVLDDDGLPVEERHVQKLGMFHQKVGILEDEEGHTISFSGSDNESAAAWQHNVEEFKVFRSWEGHEGDYLAADIRKFEKFWNGSPARTRIIDVPTAAKRKLIELAPDSFEAVNLDRWSKKQSGKRKTAIELWDYQKEAVNAWLNNGKKGIFEMATGTGKTFTALACLDAICRTTKKLLVVITCPSLHLISQWKKEIDAFGIEYDRLLSADSSNPSWRDGATDLMLDISLGRREKGVILTTHTTFSSDDFTQIARDNKSGFSIFLIADEVHGLGADKSRRGLIEEYDLRLALSATPRRWFDPAGTEMLYDYFGNTVYEFSLEHAINQRNPATRKSFLTPYRYMPRFISLSGEELEEYVEKTRTIVRNLKKEQDNEDNQVLQLLMFQRANIVKTAVNKYAMLEKILDEISLPPKWTIIYCSPQQIDKVMEIVQKRHIVAHRFTMDEGTSPSNRYGGLSERDFLLQKFAEGKYQVLVAMKCLDEGVDVPPARIAVLMASSGNPREYIQRIGRVIRRSRNKTEATIYDIIAAPLLENVDPKLKEIERAIFEKESERYEEIASVAINSIEALSSIYDVKNINV